MSLPSGIRRKAQELYAAATSARGREVGLFLVFLLISYVFWLLLTLNNEMQDDVDVPVELVGVPDSVTLITSLPPAVKVSVRDKGSVLVRRGMSAGKVMKISWDNFTPSANRLLVNRAELGAMLRDYFAASTQVVSVMPDSLKVLYTTMPGRMVKVNVPLDLKPVFGNVIGKITVSTDSVTVYSVDDLPHDLTRISTIPVVRGGLTDTTRITARFEPQTGVRIVPDEIEVTVAVEPLIRRTQQAPLTVKGLPSGRLMHTFPSAVEISYLVPMSDYASAPYPVKAYVDYDEALKSSSGKVAVTLSLLPEIYHNAEVMPDSVEYIIENVQR